MTCGQLQHSAANWDYGGSFMDPQLLREFLRSWPYDPEHNVRVVRGKDGKEESGLALPLFEQVCV